MIEDTKTKDFISGILWYRAEEKDDFPIFNSIETALSSMRTKYGDVFERVVCGDAGALTEAEESSLGVSVVLGVSGVAKRHFILCYKKALLDNSGRIIKIEKE